MERESLEQFLNNSRNSKPFGVGSKEKKTFLIWYLPNMPKLKRDFVKRNHTKAIVVYDF